MARSVFWRLYRARPLPSLVMCLPGLLLVGWYAWSAFAQLDRYRRAVHEANPLTLETLHIALHDQLEADIRRMLMEPPPDPSSLYTFRLRVKRQDWKTLINSAELRTDRPYVEAKVEHDGELLDAELRLRGNRHWHTGGAQKSLKVKLEKGDLIRGYRIFNLINDPTPMLIGEQLILDLAKDNHVLTPVASFVRAKVNGKDIGVYHYETAADESLLRSSRRMPGSIYQSELPGFAETHELWSSSKFWTKVSSRTDADADRTDFSDLERFLFHVSRASGRQFQEFAAHELNLESFARLDALDVAFGGDQRDFRENHNYYFDPYRGHWEPIAGEFRGFRDDPLFNLVDNPVLLRLKMNPGYLSLRDRRLYEFLTGEGTPAAISARAMQLLSKLGPELRTDPYWDAYRQLPRVDAFHRRMVRPLTLRRLALVVESELTTYGHRHAQLIGELERNPLYVAMGQPLASPRPGVPGSAFVTPLDVLIDGPSGVALSELAVTFADACAAPVLSLFTSSGAELELRGRGGQLELAEELPLHPNIGIVPRNNPDARRGEVRAQVLPIAYRLELASSCRPASLVVRGRHLATDSKVVSRPAPPELLARVPSRRLGPEATPSFAPGEVAPHPWQFEIPRPSELSLGPGDVKIESTRVFEPSVKVTVRPGTRLLMGAGASLVFLGRVSFAGERHEPIEILPLGPLPWGGVAIQGPGSQGSSLRHVNIRRGTEPAWRSVPYPALVNIHDTRDVSVKGCQLTENGADSDALHVAYVEGLTVEDTVFINLNGDAFDLEYSSAELRRLRMVNIGDDGLDLMGSRVLLSDSVLVGARGNGVSSGEESQISIRNTLIAEAGVGVLAKNAARVALSGSVLFRNGTGVRTYRRTVRYAGDSEVNANILFVAESKKSAVKRDNREDDRLDQGRVLLDLPRPGALEHVLQNVLELSDWQKLPSFVIAQKEGAIR